MNMSESVKDLKVTSNVGRDILASASLFKADYAVVWEYVVNSLQYCAPRVTPVIDIDLQQRKKLIAISDNGLGMNEQDLEHFFMMHGENKERKAGRIGRGKYGTGKSAAFGIGKGLKVDTRKNGRRNVVILTRDVIEQSAGLNVPLDWQIQNEECADIDGTTVTIFDIEVKVTEKSIAGYIEKHLQHFQHQTPKIAVNSHVCSYKEPEVDRSKEFTPNKVQADIIGGDVKLVVNVSKIPLGVSEFGIQVTAGAGNCVAIESAGVDKKELGNYLFGTVDVPLLESSTGPVEPYDQTRNLQLNPNHPVAQCLIGFIGASLDQVRKELVRETKDAQQDEQLRRLAQEASKIADILNDDFKEMRDRLQDIRSGTGRKATATGMFGGGEEGGDEPGSYVKGTKEPGDTRVKPRPGGPGDGTKRGRKDPNISVSGDPNPDGDDAVDPIGGKKKKRRPAGGFKVEYKPLGQDEPRSHYDSSTLTILLNTEHPVLAAAQAGGEIEDPAFKRLSYEIAFSEYALGLGYELANDDPGFPADDLLYEVRTSLNRVSKAAAPLYRS